MKSSTSSFDNSSRRTNYSSKFDLPDDGGGVMLPIFLNDLRSRDDDEQKLVKVTLELNGEETATPGHLFAMSLLALSRSIRKKLSRLRSFSWRDQSDVDELPPVVVSDRDVRRIKAKLHRATSSAQRALKGLRFISKTTEKADVDEIYHHFRTFVLVGDRTDCRILRGDLRELDGHGWRSMGLGRGERATPASFAS